MSEEISGGVRSNIIFTASTMLWNNSDSAEWTSFDSIVISLATVIVKDMSRVGRDYLQVGFYTEVFFREKGVHFVAISNGCLLYTSILASYIDVRI